VGKYGLIPGYILYLGNIRKIKNIPRLVDAYRLLRKRCPDVPPLVLAGRDQIPRVTLAFRGDNSIHLVGEVALADMPSLYSCASLFAFPSLYEGFGLPPLEAMACRCPVVASTGGSLPEILGDAALLPDPGDMEAIADAITRVLLDADLRRTLVERGSARVRHFSWERAAKATFEIYREVAARS
jgi:glycosyltransferase involved in cell wall biosynthesis